MRILFTCIRSVSHFGPMVPFAETLQERGHDVRIAAIAEMSEEIAKRGFEHLVLDGPTDAERDAVRESLQGIPVSEVGKIYVPRFFMGVLARVALPGLIDALQHWRPDLIVREPTEFAGIVAAQKLGIRHVRIEILNGESEEAIASKYHAEFDALRALAGLPPQGPGYLREEPAFSAHPQVLDDTPRVNTQPPVRYRFRSPQTSGAPQKREWQSGEDRPFIYATFGTVAGEHVESHGIYRQALEAFSGLPFDVLLTTGREAPADLCAGAPANVTVRDFVPQAEVLPDARLMVCHGGSGTVVAGLAAGVPMVITPLFADQPDNARCLAEAGVAVSIPDVCATSLREAVLAALDDGGLRQRAKSAAGQIAGMPYLDRAVDLMLGE